MPSPADVRAEAAKADQAHETAKAKADAADEAAGSPEPTLQPRSSHPSWQLPKPSTSPSKRKPERRVSQVLGRYLDEAPSQGEAFDTSPSPPGASPPSATSDVLPSEPAPAEAPDTLGIVEQSSASRGPLGSDAMAAVWETAASKRQGPFDTTEPGEEAEAKQDEAAEGGGVEPDPIWGTGTSRAWGEPSDQAGAEERLLVETMKPARLPDPDIHSPAGFPTRSGPIQEERLSPDVFLSSRPTIAHDADDDIFTSFTRVKLERVQENPFATIEQRTVEEVVERVVDRVTDRVTDRGGKEEPAAERRSRDVWQPTAPVENEAARHFEEGLDLMRSGRYEEALEKWKAAISLEPGNRTYQSNIRRLKRMMESGDEPRW